MNLSVMIGANWGHEPFRHDRPVDNSIFACTMDLTTVERYQEYLDQSDRVAHFQGDKHGKKG